MGGSWENHKKTPENGEFWVFTPIVGPATSKLYVYGRCLKFLWYILKNLNQKHFFISKMMIRCWDTRIQSYPTSASKIKNTKCSAWLLLYFLFTADGWNFCGIFLSPWTKIASSFKISIRCWNIRDQIYPISASKIKSTNCSAWPLLYSLFTADGWNFCGTFLRS